jgi:membrane protease YdiL (CAAX protease family)
MINNNPIKPLTFRVALLYFGIPSAVAILVVYVVMPFLARLGLPIFINYLLVYATAPMLALLVASVVAYQREGYELSCTQFKKRFRLHKLKPKAWLWTFGLMLFMVLSASALSTTSRWLASFSFISPPDSWPAELNPTTGGPTVANAIPTELMGVPLAGNWWVLLALTTSLIIATLGEEFWWRGYILPRQELAHGKRTWIIHGLMWALFHVFAPWNLIAILPGCLALSYVTQRLKNTWPAVIAHGLANGLAVLVITVLGITR